MLLVAVFYVFSTSAWEIRHTEIAEAFFCAGVILVGIAALGRMWCSVYIAGYKHGTLITEGPYSLCRNPLYVFSFLGSVGVGLSSETLLIPTIIGIAFVSYYPLVVRKEEEQLLKVHGEKYQAYLESVPRFLPSFKGFVEPTDYVVKPTVFRRHLTSAVWFIWIPAAAEFVEMLHREAMIPSLFSIY